MIKHAISTLFHPVLNQKPDQHINPDKSSQTPLVVKILSILLENFGDSSSIQNLFLLSKKSIPDAILIPCSQFRPYEYIEGGDFRKSLN